MGVFIVAQTQLSSFAIRKAHSPSPSCFRIRHRFASCRWLTPQFYPPQRLGNFHTRCSFVGTEVFDHVAIEEDNFRTSCSIVNTEVFDHVATEEDNFHTRLLDHVATDEEFHQDLTTDSNSPVSSDILESEAINLLAKGTYLDTLLTTLPVLSEEEQNIIAATPAHPAGLYALYASCLAGNLVEQLWNFAWPAAVAMLHPSLLPVAVVGFISKLAVIVGGPLVGKLMDYFPRVPSYNCLSVIQAAAQLLSVGMIIHAHRIRPGATSSVLLQPWFVVLVLAGAVERLSGLALGVAVERDWIVLLAGINRPIALAHANAIINRIDLLCEIAGASLFGILFSRYEPVTCLKLAANCMVWALPVTVILTWLTNKLSSGVLDRAPCCRSSSEGSLLGEGNIVEVIKSGWVEYMQQPVLPASLACVLLSFNVVLAPGGLMTTFLTQRDLAPSIIGGFSGLCALVGVAATFLSANMVKRLGILKAGAAGLILQASLLTIAVAVYWTGSLSQQMPLMFFLSLIVLSRLGHMSYDVLGAQIIQTGIPPSKANLIGTTEVSVASLAECLMLGIAIIANDVSHFGFLAVLSLLSVVGSAWLFCRWLSNPTDTQRALFSFG